MWKRYFSIFTHLDSNNKAKFVNSTKKDNTLRIASASGVIRLGKHVSQAIKEQSIKKGDVLTVAKIAAIQAAKHTSHSIPLCHPIHITSVDIDFNLSEEKLDIKAIVSAYDKTGVEMEALHAVSIAALTVYDMCKALSKDMIITSIKLDTKSVDYVRK
jgi:cyclic pyranopterin phosphate synthase